MNPKRLSQAFAQHVLPIVLLALLVFVDIWNRPVAVPPCPKEEVVRTAQQVMVGHWAKWGLKASLSEWILWDAHLEDPTLEVEFTRRHTNRVMPEIARRTFAITNGVVK